ncbi:MAG: BamA/TamA family outer membrane protein [Salibacteraceae bacterium]
MVVNNTIHLNENDKYDFDGDENDLASVIKQEEYRKIAGIVPFHISVWNWASQRNQDRKLWAYLTNTVGEAPTIYEPILLEKTKDQMIKTLRNMGYFDARVRAFALLDDKTAEQHFYVYTGDPYLIRKVSYAFEDTALIKEFKEGVKTELRPGTRFDAAVFEQERDRLTKTMKNLGYYTFDKIHVIFDVDTHLQGHRFDVSVRLRNLREENEINGKDTIVERSHEKHFIHTVTINENYTKKGNSQRLLDTLSFRNSTYLYYEQPFIRPLRISRNLYVNKGDQYSLARTNYTYDRLSALNNFRFINLEYNRSQLDSSVALIDLNINLTKSAKQAFSIETTGTNRSGNLGVSAGVNYKNRNLFRGAEQLNWRIYGGLESQRTNSTSADRENQVIRNVSIFNTYEFGTQVTLTIPDLLFRSPKSQATWFREPKTNISVSLDRQARPLYERNLVNTNYQYTFRIRPKDQLTIAPIDLSVIGLIKEPEFEKQLQSTNNSLLINSYNDHIIASGRVSYAFTTQDVNEKKNFYYYRLNFESAGNALRGLSKPLKLDYDESRNSYLINNIAFAQYVKLDANFTQYLNLTKGTQFVYRFFGGIGLSLDNLNTLPFERSFFGGGSNGIRAWRARALGPGSLSDTATYGIDQVGESQIEINFEYRFKIIDQLEGALFTDIGNIWINSFDPQRKGANFEIDRFYKEIAIAPGAGIRLNFGFFILRFDLGLKFKDPGLPEGERWLFQPKTITNQSRREANDSRESRDLDRLEEWDQNYRPDFTFNLGIGYPF